MASPICYLTVDDQHTYRRAKQFFTDHHFPIDCYLFQTEEHQGGEVLARELIREGARIFIARGGTSVRLQKLVPALTVPLSYDFLDFYRPAMEACAISDKVAVVGWYEHLPLFGEFKKLLPSNLTYYEFPHPEMPQYGDIVDMIDRLKRDGIRCVVGGSTVFEAAQDAGMRSFLVEVSEGAFLQAAREAIHYNKILEEKDAWHDTAQSILENVREGFIFSDSRGHILQINSAAREMFHITQEVLSKPEATLDTLGIPESISTPLLHGRGVTNRAMDTSRGKILLSGEILQSKGQDTGILITVESMDNIRSMEHSLRRSVVGSGRYARYSFSDITGNSPAILTAKETAQLYAGSSSTVLITGESGTGKELFAQSIHNASQRRKEPFVAINCAALPENILESELFGYVKGAFTGARSEGKAGIFELADKGTIFLDEIGEISPKLQSQLLRVLQEREITRIGDSKVIPIDVRVIAATNRNLIQAVKKGSFREDLFYRICVLSLSLPPLRQRKQDIPLLLEDLLRQLGRGECAFTREAMELVTEYDWPGNIRELGNFAERLNVLSPTSPITVQTVHRAIAQPGAAPENTCAPDPEDPDRVILSALRDCLGNRQKTAQRLGISRNTLWRKLKEIELRRGSLDL